LRGLRRGGLHRDHRALTASGGRMPEPAATHQEPSAKLPRPLQMSTLLARTFTTLLVALGLAGTALATSESATTPPPAPATAASAPAALDARVQALKAEVLRLNRDLLVLEEELLFPPGTQLAVFLSLEAGPAFELESVKLLVNDSVVASHLYNAQELQALRRGGVQRLYLGNLRTGKHQITAQLSGRAANDRDYKRTTRIDLDKGSEPRTVELKIRDREAKQQPDFEVKVWP
jgi:hypothetical protein